MATFFQGKWKPRRIENPDYFHDPEPFERMTSIAAVGIELWSMSSDIYFDNILVTSDPKVADTWAAETFDLKLQKVRPHMFLIKFYIYYMYHDTLCKLTHILP